YDGVIFFSDCHARHILILNKNRECEPSLLFHQVGRKARYKRSKRSDVATGRRDAAFARPVRHIRSAMVILRAESYVLAGHVVESGRAVEASKLVSGVGREIGRS